MKKTSGVYSEGRSSDWEPSNSSLIILSCIVVFLIGVIIYNQMGVILPTKTPDVVLSLIDRIVKGEDIRTSLSECVSFEVTDTNVLDMKLVFRLYGTDIPVSYEVLNENDGYVEFVVKGKTGKPQYPRLFMFYKVDNDGLISDYTIGRLQPFSTRDEEYNKKWD